MNRFVLKNSLIKKIHISLFNKKIIKIRSQSYTLETVSLSKTILFLSMEGVYVKFNECYHIGKPS